MGCLVGEVVFPEAREGGIVGDGLGGVHQGDELSAMVSPSVEEAALHCAEHVLEARVEYDARDRLYHHPV